MCDGHVAIRGARGTLQDKDDRTRPVWDRVSTNLAAKRLRLLFIAGRILARVVEFLNSQMRAIEVLAVEVKFPRQFGGDVRSPRSGGRRRRGREFGRSIPVTRELFLAVHDGIGRRRRGCWVAERRGAFRWGKTGLCHHQVLSVGARPPSLGSAHPRSSTNGRVDTWGHLRYEDQLDGEVWKVLTQWADRSVVPYAADAYSKGYKAWL